MRGSLPQLRPTEALSLAGTADEGDCEEAVGGFWLPGIRPIHTLRRHTPDTYHGAVDERPRREP